MSKIASLILALPWLVVLWGLMLQDVEAAGPTNQTYVISWKPTPNVFLGPTNVSMSPDGYELYMTTNPLLPLSQWMFVTNPPTVYTLPDSPVWLAVTQAVVSVTLQPPVFATATYTNSWGSSAPLFSIGGLQTWPGSPKILSVSPAL